METFLWVEKYRPTKINDCILPDELKKTFGLFVQDKHIPNLILSGGPGVGKTTVAKAMLDEIGATYTLGVLLWISLFQMTRNQNLHLNFLQGLEIF